MRPALPFRRRHVRDTARWLGVIALVVSAVSSSPARAADRNELPFTEQWGGGLQWIAQPVKPVSPGDVTGSPPYVPGAVADVTGAIEVSERRGIAFWLSPLEVVEVTGEPGALTFERVEGERDPRASFIRIREPGVSVRPGTWYLAEPIGEGSVWIVTAKKPTKVLVQRPAPVDAPLAAESLRAHVLAWIDGSGTLPPLPMNGELLSRLTIDAELGDTLLRSEPSQGAAQQHALAAVRAWRKASALQMVDAATKPDPVTSRIAWSAPEGESIQLDGFASPFAQVHDADGTWTVDAEGPGQLSVEARAVVAAKTTTPVSVSVDTEGRTIATTQALPQPSFVEPVAALPKTRTPRLLPNGDAIGQAAELRIAVPAGRHRYRIAWNGGAVLLRAMTAQRRPWTAEAISGTSDWSDWSKRASAELPNLSPLSAAVLRARLAALDPSLPRLTVAEVEGMRALSAFSLAPELRAALLSDLAEVALTSTQRLADARDAAKILSTGWQDDGGELAWSIRIRTAQALVQAGDAHLARELLRTAPEFPHSGVLAAQAAAVVASLPDPDALRSRVLAALELAWRKDPLADSVKQQYRDAWAQSTRWLPLSPDDSERARPMPARWLDREPTDGVTTFGAGTLWPIEAGATAVRIDGATSDERALVLRAFVTRPEQPAKEITLTVDDLAIPVFSEGGTEAVEVALPKGEHSVKLDGPVGACAWLSQTPLATTAEMATQVGYLRTHWPIRADGHPVEFELPDARLPTPVRVQLRLAGTPGKSANVWVRTDVGEPLRLTLQDGGARNDHVSLDVSPGVSSPSADAVVFVPPFAHVLWFESDDADAHVFASVAVRRDALSTPPNVQPDVASSAPPALDELYTLSRRITENQAPQDALLRRAELLLDASEDGLAREDLTRLLSRQDTLDANASKKLAALLARVEGDGTAWVRFNAPLTKPLVLAPGFAAVAKDATPATRYAHARALAASGHSDEAALELVRLYQSTKAPQVGLEALQLLGRVDTTQPSWREWGAPITAALVEQLADYADLPTVRHMRFVSAQWARWKFVRDAETSVGTVPLSRATPDEELPLAVRKALVAAPWPMKETRLVAPDRASVFELAPTSTIHVGAQAMCGSYRGARRVKGKPCAFTLRMDGKVVAEQRAAVGEIVTLAAEVPEGHHQLELHHADTDAPVVAAVRFVSIPSDESAAPTTLSAPEPLPALRARPDMPVVMTVLGPAAVRVGARAFGPKSTQTLRVLDGAAPYTTLALAADADGEVTGASEPVGVETDTTLLLAEPGPHALRFESPDGEALVRVQLGRSERPAQQDGEWWSHSPSTVEPLPWPALAPKLSVLPASTPWADEPRDLGTLSAQAGYIGDDYGEDDVLSGTKSRLDLRVAYRQELARRSAWVLVEPDVRLPLEVGPVLGGRAAFHARKLPLGLRFTVGGAMYTQTVDAVTRVAARGRAALDDYVAITPDLGFIPGASFTAERVQHGKSVDLQQFDHLVYSQYAQDHPIRWMPQLTLRWTPLLDEVGELSAYASSNKDLVTADHVAARVGWATLFRSLPGARAGLAWEESWRFQDANRAQAYLRHGVTLHADYGIWKGSDGRLMFFAEDQAFLGGPAGLQNVISAGVRWDWTSGRGLRDVLPYEEEFEQLLDPTHLDE